MEVTVNVSKGELSPVLECTVIPPPLLSSTHFVYIVEASVNTQNYFHNWVTEILMTTDPVKPGTDLTIIAAGEYPFVLATTLHAHNVFHLYDKIEELPEIDISDSLPPSLLSSQASLTLPMIQYSNTVSLYLAIRKAREMVDTATSVLTVMIGPSITSSDRTKRAIRKLPGVKMAFGPFIEAVATLPNLWIPTVYPSILDIIGRIPHSVVALVGFKPTADTIQWSEGMVIGGKPISATFDSFDRKTVTIIVLHYDCTVQRQCVEIEPSQCRHFQ